MSAKAFIVNCMLLSGYIFLSTIDWRIALAVLIIRTFGAPHWYKHS